METQTAPLHRLNKRGRPNLGLNQPLTMRFNRELLAKIHERATAEDLSASAWIRRSCKRELRRKVSL